jgi:hypothetical protein
MERYQKDAEMKYNALIKYRFPSNKGVYNNNMGLKERAEDLSIIQVTSTWSNTSKFCRPHPFDYHVLTVGI